MQELQKLTVGLFCDRVDWITGTMAIETARLLQQTGQFRVQVVSQKDFLQTPLAQIGHLNDCDLIHWISGYGYKHYGALFPDIPQICTLHHCLPGDDDYPSRYEGVTVTTVSKQSADELNARGFGKVPIIHLGVNPAVLAPVEQKRARSELKIETSIPLIGFFGKGSSNPADRKGTDVFVNTVREILKHRLVGVLLSGSGWEPLITQLRESGVVVYHRMTACVADMKWMYGAVDLYLCTSRVEGGPVTILEAMACGCPVVSTPVGHVTEVVEHGKNGLIVPINDYQAATDAVLQLLSDTGWRDGLGNNGRETVLQDWDWDNQLKPVETLYASVAAANVLAKYNWLSRYRALFMLLARSAHHHYSS